jgi:hypothetical protein
MVRETAPEVLEVCADSTMVRETAPEVLEVHATGTMVRVTAPEVSRGKGTDQASSAADVMSVAHRCP